MQAEKVPSGIKRESRHNEDLFLHCAFHRPNLFQQMSIRWKDMLINSFFFFNEPVLQDLISLLGKVYVVCAFRGKGGQISVSPRVMFMYFKCLKRTASD